MKKFYILHTLFGCSLLLAAVNVEAARAGFELSIYGDDSGKTGTMNGTTTPGTDNIPLLKLTNHPLSDFDITDFSLTIGDTNYNFDSAVISISGNTITSTGISATLNSPDNAQGSVRSDLVDYDFTAFAPGKDFVFSADVDGDGAGHTVENFENVFWNNSPDTPNAVITVTFSNGEVLTLDTQDQDENAISTYTFSAVVPPPVLIPIPPWALLFGSVLLGALGWKRLSRR